MSGFDFVLMLLSFVYALGLGHLLTSVGRLLVRRDKVLFSGLLWLALANAMLQVFVSWLSLWDFRSVESWGLAKITLFFATSVTVYLMCVVISPEPEYDQDGGQRIDLESVFWRNHRWFYGTYVALLLTYVGMSVVYLETATPELALTIALSNLPYLALAVAGVVARRAWMQWVVGVLMLGLTAYWLVVFAPSLD